MNTAQRREQAEQTQADTRGNGRFSAPERTQNSTVRAEGAPAAKRIQKGRLDHEDPPAAKQLQTSIPRGEDPSVKGAAFLCRAMRPEDVPACAAIEAAVPDGWSAGALAEELAQPTARLYVAEIRGSDVPGAQAEKMSYMDKTGHMLYHMPFHVNEYGSTCPVRAPRTQLPDRQTADGQLPDGQPLNEQTANTQPPDAQTSLKAPLHTQGIAALAVFQLVCEEASLYTISTAPALRRRGAAHALLQYAFAQLAEQGAQTVFLEVRAQNKAARALYTALGFEETGTRRGFYTKPNDNAVLMRRTIGTSPFTIHTP